MLRIPPLLLLCLLAPATLLASPAPGPTFSRDVLPILSDHCFQCHGPDPKNGRKGDLRLDDETDAKRTRKGHHVVMGGNAEASELMRRLLSADPEEQMPPAKLGRPLSAAQIETIRQWIQTGAAWGKHWAIEPVVRPETKEGIDALVERRLGQHGLSPSPQAPRESLIRRLALDLTGLPPTPEETAAFLADQRPGAWERLVDRILASPAYGERMAWDWLDAARYADTNGYQGDNERTMWPWRDWVVRAFNENLPYDQFTVWQLAGDQLPNPTKEQILATAFNRNHMINGEGGRIPEENRIDYVMDMTETMGTVWLGLTLNCCRCHDHKFDPIRQREYYQLTAFFNQTPVTGGGGNAQTAPVQTWSTVELDGALTRAQTDLDQATATLTAEEAKRWPTGSEAMKALPGQVLGALTKKPATRSKEDWEELSKQFAVDALEWARLKAVWMAQRDVRDRASAAIPRVMVMEDQKTLRPTFVLDHGLYDQPRDAVSAGVPASLPPLNSPVANRLALAQWLVRRDQPLTARVTVNRFWQMLFGIGLVKTAEDFGLQAEAPVQPEVLDWLAAEFMESGWDVKHLLRTIVTSRTYQQSSAWRGAADEADPLNLFVSRGPRFRMPSWMLRDQALALSGLLRPFPGGPGVNAYQPEGIWEEATFGNKKYPMSHGDDLHRRSLYTFWRRIVGPTVFFDAAKRQVCQVKPQRTNTPMHALTTLNDVTFVEAARALAQRLLLEPGSDEDRFQRAGKLLLARSPAPAEVAIWRRGLTRADTAFRSDPAAAEKLLAQGEAPRDPSIDPVRHAAWTTLCLTLLNLDETLTKE